MLDTMDEISTLRQALILWLRGEIRDALVAEVSPPPPPVYTTPTPPPPVDNTPTPPTPPPVPKSNTIRPVVHTKVIDRRRYQQ